jgi:lipopolysaccharide assembly outer membrane protein LptD (OstA)
LFRLSVIINLITARARSCFALSLFTCLFVLTAQAQQTNPVDRKVENPLTDTPYVNPLQQDQPVKPATKGLPRVQPGDNLDVTCARESVTGPKEARVSTCEGNVDARIGTFRMQADKVTVYDATNLVVADGNVVFDQGDQQRITGSHAELQDEDRVLC